MDGLLVALVGLAGAALGTLTNIVITRLTKSGKVDTTEAATLWKEASDIRTELRDQVQYLTEVTESQTEKIKGLTTTVTEQEIEIKKLRAENEDSHRQIHLLEARIDNMLDDSVAPIEKKASKGKKEPPK